MNVAKKSFICLFLATGLTCSLAHATYADTINALSTFKDQLIALANMLGSDVEFQETAQRLEIQKKFIEQTKAVTPEGQELAKILEEKTELPPEIAKIAVGYLELKELKGTLEGTLNNEGPVYALLPLPDGTLASSSRGTIKIWDLKHKQLIRSIDAKLITGGRTTSLVVVSPNTFASGSDDGSIKIWNTEGELLHTLGEAATTDTYRSLPPSMLLALRHDGKLISAFGSIITVWDPDSGRKITTTTRSNGLRTGFITSLGIAPNGSLVLGGYSASGRHGMVTYLDSTTLQESQSIALPKQGQRTNIVAFPHGTIAAASNETISILPPSAQQGTIPQELEIPGPEFSFFDTLAILPDGRLASGHRNALRILEEFEYDIIIWNYDKKSNSWAPQLTLAGNKDTIISLAVLSDGRLVSGDAAGVIDIWR